MIMQCLNLTPGDCRVGVQHVYAVSEPTFRGLSSRGAACLCSVSTYLPGTVGQGCSMFMQCRNLPLRNCGAGVQHVYAVSEPTSQELWGRGAACLCSVGTYLSGTVGQGCSMFMQCPNLPLRDCGAGVQHVYAVSEPTSQGLWGRGAACYAVSEPTSQGLWGRGAACLYSVGTYLIGTEGQGRSMFMQCWNLPLGDCGAGVQHVYAVLKPTSWGLWGRGEAC